MSLRAPAYTFSHLSSKIHSKFSFKNSISFYTNKQITRGRLIASLSTNIDVQIRPLANFPSDIWKDVDTIVSDVDQRLHEFNETYGGEIEELKNKMKEILIGPANDLVDKVYLIDSINRLGVSYYFETEIEEQLNHIFESNPNLFDEYDYDLYSIALIFRVSRQNGFSISSDCFNKFKENEGKKFKKTLTSDGKGLLSLYEATFVNHHGENILEVAREFSKTHLKSLLQKSNPRLAKRITIALETPPHRGISRLETVKYIDYYKNDHDYRNDNLLLLAKLDFNRVQLLYQQELGQILRWWKNLKLAAKLPYKIRDRIVESFFGTIALHFEPSYSRARSIGCKLCEMLTVVDDTYDAYGTLEELRLFTSAIQMWDVSAADDLPDYLKIIYSNLLNVMNEIEDELKEEDGSYKVSCTKKMITEMFGGHLTEAEWLNKNYIPTFNEYWRNALLTIGTYAFAASFTLGMGGEILQTNTLDWLQAGPSFVKAIFSIVRLIDDLMTHEFEKKRPHVASSVDCYMREYKTSMEEANEELRRMVEYHWKDINEGFMKPTQVSPKILLAISNMARVMQVFYQKEDGFTHPQHIKEHVNSVLFDQIPI